jgi:[ribosomal protein S5]-alanine N-acetyltransferase
MPDINTERLIIQKFTEEYLTNNYVDWLNDNDIVRYSDQRFKKHSIDTCRQYWQSFKGSPNEFWAILEKCSHKMHHIGNLTTYVDENHGLVDISIMIGDKSLWGQGYGLEAWSGMCKYLLGIDSTRKITAGTLAVNTPMLKIFKKSGMVKDGIRKNNCLYNGKPVDMIYYTIFNKD